MPDQRQRPRDPAGHVCAALSGGSRVSLQASMSPARDAAATGARHEALQAMPRADLALGEQFSWLRFGADQERISMQDSRQHST